MSTERPVAEGVSPVPGEDPARLAEAEQSLRRIAANPTVCNAAVGVVDALRLRTLLAEYDRRGVVEKAAADLVRIAAAGPDASRGEYQEAVTALIAAVRTNGAFRG